MISMKSTVLRRLYKKPVTRVGIESVRVGMYVRTINCTTGEYSYARVASIVKLTLPRYEISTTTFETILASPMCKFFSLDGLKVPWSPGMKFDNSTRLFKRESTKLMFPFIYSVKNTGFYDTFYDMIIESDLPNVAVLVDGYAKIFTTKPREKNE